MNRVCVSPEPLFFRVPNRYLHDVMCQHSCEIGPDFLCFEAFYQAVAETWPHDMTVVDVGGAYGIQGWLFRDFREYVCVDFYDMLPSIDGFPVGKRCVLPANGRHVTMDGIQYMRGMEHVDTDNILFISSAVPCEQLRAKVRAMENSVVWYPVKEMSGNGPCMGGTVNEFNRLEASGWEHQKNEAIRRAFKTDAYWKRKLEE